MEQRIISIFIKSKFFGGTKKYKTEKRYNVNIAGTFGSANLAFSRQKRDEVRSAIQHCVKKYNRKNIDRHVAKFS